MKNSIDHFINEIFSLMRDQVEALYQHDFHIFDKRDTDFVKTFIPPTDSSGRVAEFNLSMQRRHPIMKYMYKVPQFSFSNSFALTIGQSLELYVCDTDRLKDIQKVKFKSEFDVWVKKGTHFDWWDYDLGRMRTR